MSNQKALTDLNSKLDQGTNDSKETHPVDSPSAGSRIKVVFERDTGFGTCLDEIVGTVGKVAKIAYSDGTIRSFDATVYIWVSRIVNVLLELIEISRKN